jgi:oxygen-independent coproporphyrinogen-3 oxidase
VTTGRPFGVYVHVPFCASRCGYCDFNTYTVGELDDPAAGHRGRALLEGYPDAAIAELHGLAAARPARDDRPASTVFFGGGTPTALASEELVRILGAVADTVGLAPDAEITVEANPDSVTPASLRALVDGGFTRISFGMQSVRAHVLAVLDRTHTPGRPEAAATEARAAGFAQVNLDLIYGAPGERDADWQATLGAALAAGPDHVSAYALTVEPRTRLAARVRRGALPRPDDDVAARRYAMADDTLTAAGFGWYELSNWAAGVDARSRHNQLYWRNDDWWGVGPGAHSHVDGRRRWNVDHPAAYAALVHAGLSAEAGSETLTAAERALEDLLLGIRLVDGFALDRLAGPTARLAARRQADEGFLDPWALAEGRLVLTRTGRLVADSVVAALVG